MKNFVLIFTLILLGSNCFCQTTESLDKEIDSLSSIKEHYQAAIKGIDSVLSVKLAMKNNAILDNTDGKNYVCIDATNIIKSPQGYDIVSKLPRNSKVKVIGEQPDYYQVIYLDYTGWAPQRAFISEGMYNIRIRQERAKIVEEQQRKDDILKNYGPVNGQRILKGEIWVGMTSGMIIESIGKPDKINRTIGKWGSDEQWVYETKGYYLYVENGKLTSLQDSH